MGERADELTVALAQIEPVWLDRKRTLEKVAGRMTEAAKRGADLVVFGEALVPGYPFWLDSTGGARFDSPLQKEMHAIYLDNGVCIEEGHLDALTELAAAHSIAVYLGVIERPLDRGGHSLYASLVHISSDGEILSVHRKMMPTYEERLVWSVGDGNGLRVHPVGRFRVGGLNCWENWMPLARTALYGLGEDLHVAVWPGNDRNTEEITRYIAKESRSFVVSVSGVMRSSSIPEELPVAEQMKENAGPDSWLANGGSCLAAPDGAWVIEPFTKTEELKVATIDHARVREERQNFDAAGHYSRPDVLRLTVDRRRQTIIDLEE